MSDFKFELNKEGVRELLQSAEMQKIVSEAGSRVLESCGEGYEIKNGVGATRAGSTVFPTTRKAANDNRKNKTLQKALGRVKV